MRPVIVVLVLAMLFGLLAFGISNSTERVSVTLWNAEYPEVRLFLVVLMAFITGAAFSGVIGIIEGVSDRLARRRLQREVQRLESELEMLRDRPADERAPIVRSEEPAGPASPPARQGGAPASAPVYGDGQSDLFPGAD